MGSLECLLTHVSAAWAGLSWVVLLSSSLGSLVGLLSLGSGGVGAARWQLMLAFSGHTLDLLNIDSQPPVGKTDFFFFCYGELRLVFPETKRGHFKAS